MNRQTSFRSRPIAAVLGGLTVFLVLTQMPTPSTPPEAVTRIRDALEAARFTEAESLAREHLADTSRDFGARSIEYAHALDLLVDALLGGGKAIEQETGQLARTAVDLKRSLLSDTDPGLGTSLVLLGRVHFDRGDPSTAAELTGQSLNIQESAWGLQDVRLIPTLRNLGNALLADGDLVGTEEVFRRLGELIATHHGDANMDAASHAYNTARFMVEVGDWEEAKRLYQRAANIIEQLHGSSNSRMAFALLGVANTDALLGDSTAALESHERALSIAKQTLRPDHPFLASCHTGIGFALLEVGDLDAARRAFTRALELARREYGPNHEATGRALRLLAGVAREAGDLEQAEDYLTRAREIFARSRNENLDLEARLEYAQLLADRGELDAAIAELQTVHRVSSEKLPDHPDTMGRGVDLGNLMLRANRPDEAREVLRTAVDKFTKHLAEDHLKYIEGLADLALASAITGHGNEAVDIAARTETLGINRVRVLIAGLSERRALRFAAERASALDLLVTLAAIRGQSTAVAAAWDAVTHARGAVLDELARRRRTVAELGESAAAGEFVVASRRLANLLVHGPSGDVETFRQSVDEARRRREAAERELARASRHFQSVQAERAVGFDRVREALPADSALVAYVVYDHYRGADPQDKGETPSVALDRGREYAAFVLPVEGRPRLHRLGRAADVDASVHAVRASLQDGVRNPGAKGESSYRAVATKLRNLVWEPVSAELGEPKRVFIVPAGALHLVSFATLPEGKDRYLADSDRVFHYLSAERELARASDKRRGRGLLVVGGPDYDTAPAAATSSESSSNTSDSSVLIASTGGVSAASRPGGTSAFRGDTSGCPEFSDILFGPLGSAAAEARSVARRWAAASSTTGDEAVLVLDGPEASEQAFKREASGRRVLHLATHGFFLDGECPSAALEHRGIGGLSRREREAGARPGSAESLLILSGLALAGANRRSMAGPNDEDGILTAEEIAALDLDGTEWAVLSACDTGLGRIRPGEGVFGLRRAFRIAGARTLIMTLWPVRDDVASVWMDRLYEMRLERGMDTAASVAGATRAVLEHRRENGLSTHPAVWGAFVASGDWR